MSQVLVFTIWQAFLSAGLALALGFWGAMGLWGLNKSRKIFISLALVPNTLPIVFVIFSFMKYLAFARGIFGIVLVHVALNAGLAAIAIFQILESKVGGLAEIAWIDGCSRPRFVARVALPYLKNDLARVFFFVFAICFTSFAVPLMLGGSQGTTIEVLIYEKIHVANDWSRALFISAVEMLFIFALSFIVRREVVRPVSSFSKSPLMSSLTGLLVLFLPALFVCVSLLKSIFTGARVPVESFEMGLGSSFIAIGSGLLSFLLLMLCARFRPSVGTRRFFLGLASPSAVILGFALIWLFRAGGIATYFKLILGLSLMHFPVLYRLSWDSQIFSLSRQIEVARSMGALDKNIFGRVLAPQILKSAYHLSGLAALWAFADFTLASVVAEKDVTLAQLFSHLTETYRWEAAESLILPMMIGSLLCYILFAGVGHVASRIALR